MHGWHFIVWRQSYGRSHAFSPLSQEPSQVQRLGPKQFTLFQTYSRSTCLNNSRHLHIQLRKHKQFASEFYSKAFPASNDNFLFNHLLYHIPSKQSLFERFYQIQSIQTLSRSNDTIAFSVSNRNFLYLPFLQGTFNAYHASPTFSHFNHPITPFSSTESFFHSIPSFYALAFTSKHVATYHTFPWK